MQKKFPSRFEVPGDSRDVSNITVTFSHHSVLNLEVPEV